jgi:hypothetical protein
MKTINEGRKDFGQQWWIGKIVECPCGFRGELEITDEDRISASAERRINGRRIVTIPCPNCEGTARYQTTPNGFGAGQGEYDR